MSKLSVIKYNAFIKVLDFLASTTTRIRKGGGGMLLNVIKRALGWFRIYYYPVLTSKEIAEKGKVQCQIIDIDRKGYYSNLVFGKDPKDKTLLSVSLPDVCVNEYRDVVIAGQSQFVYDTSTGSIVNDFSMLFDEGLYQNADSSLWLQKGGTAFLKTKLHEIKRELPQGIMITGIFAFNYYHMLFDNYIKLLAVEKSGIPKSVPIIVDSICKKYDSFQQVVNALNVCGRELIYVDRLEKVRVGHLYAISSINIIAPQARDVMNTRPMDVAFDPNYLNSLRNRLLSLKSNKTFSKRVFIRRKGYAKRSWNEDDISVYLKAKGFEEYAPQELSFSEQIALFNNAEFIVAGSGAALSNLLFCKEGCKVICVYSAKVNIPSFTTLTYMNDAYMKYMIGTPIKSSSVSNTHSDFTVDVEEFKEVFACFENE